jgi:AcrR family transcriptional regulator
MPRTRKPPAASKRVRRNNEEDADRRRKEFVEATFDLFAEGGLEAVSIRAVAARVGVSPMVMYWYFADKDELLNGLMMAVLKNLDEQLQEVLAGPPPARERLRAFIDCFLSYWESNPGRYVLTFGFSDIGKSRESKSKLASFPLYAELLDLGVQVTAAFAAELGVGTEHVKLASDVRYAMQHGFLYGTLVNKRYPWMDLATLRAAYIEVVIGAMERCLREGPGLGPPVARKVLRKRA